MNPILISISPGELLDRITILQIKADRLREPQQRVSVRQQLDELLGLKERTVPASTELDAMTSELAAVNQALWDAEDELRQCEKRQDFGQSFIQLARSIYQNNDRRSQIKCRINQLLGASVSELKIYKDG